MSMVFPLHVHCISKPFHCFPSLHCIPMGAPHVIALATISWHAIAPMSCPLHVQAMSMQSTPCISHPTQFLGHAFVTNPVHAWISRNSRLGLPLHFQAPHRMRNLPPTRRSTTGSTTAPPRLRHGLHQAQATRRMSGPMSSLTGPMRRLTGQMRRMTGPMSSLTGPMRRLTGRHFRHWGAPQCQVELNRRVWGAPFHLWRAAARPEPVLQVVMVAQGSS